MRVRFGIQKVCQSVQSAAFTLPNCFLKSHKRDLRNGSTVAKTRPDHFLFPQNTLSSSYIDFDPMKLFMMWDRGILIDNISSRPISIPILISVSISMSIVHIKSFWSLTFRFQKFLIFSNGIGFGIENIWYLGKDPKYIKKMSKIVHKVSEDWVSGSLHKCCKKKKIQKKCTKSTERTSNF